MSKKNAQKSESKKNKNKAVASQKPEAPKEEVAESPIKRVSKDGVAIFAEGMHPRTRRIEAEKAVPEAEEAEE